MEVLSRGDLDEIISFMPHGRSFRVKDIKRCEKEVLPRFFKQTQHHSFIRQLNLWGFKRITRGRDEGSYYHEMFLRGRPNLALMLRRHKVKGTKTSKNPDGEPDLYKFSVLPDLSLNRPVPALPPMSTFEDSHVNVDSDDLQTKSADIIDGLPKAHNKTDKNPFHRTVHQVSCISRSSGQDKVDQTRYAPYIVQSSGIDLPANNGLMNLPVPQTSAHSTEQFYSLAPISHKFSRAVTSDENQKINSMKGGGWNDAINFLDESIFPMLTEEQHAANNPSLAFDEDLRVNGEPFTFNEVGHESKRKVDACEARSFTRIEDCSLLPSNPFIVPKSIKNNYEAQLHIASSTPFHEMKETLLSDGDDESSLKPLDHLKSGATSAERLEMTTTTSWEDRFEVSYSSW